MRTSAGCWLPSRIVAVLAGATACAAPPNDGTLVRVPEDAATLSEAAEQVAPGGTILIAAGTYEEELQIDTPDVTVRGEDRNETVIDGGGIRPYGIVSIADGVTVENLTVTGATFYGVLFTGLHDENGPSAPTADGYTPLGSGGSSRRCRGSSSTMSPRTTTACTASTRSTRSTASSATPTRRVLPTAGSTSASAVTAMCSSTGNVAERNAVGFENANASDSVVITGNRFSGNRVGLTLLSSYQEAFTPQRANQVVGNLISDNDEADSPAQAEGGFRRRGRHQRR